MSPQPSSDSDPDPDSDTAGKAISFHYPRPSTCEEGDASAASQSCTMDSDSNFDDNSETFELISSPSLPTSDDETHEDDADSEVSLCEGSPTHSPSQSLAEREDDDLLTTPVQSQHDFEIDEKLAFPSLITSRVNISSFTSGSAIEPVNGWIEFPELPASLSDAETEVIHTLRSANFLRLRDDSLQTLSVCQTMSNKTLKLNRPFRVLYRGNPAMRDEIMTKLANAIAASKPDDMSTRIEGRMFNIVPISNFGTNDESPEVELIPSTGLEMIVVECSGFYRANYSRSNAQELVLTFVSAQPESERSSETDQYSEDPSKIQECQTPDLVIVTHENLHPESMSIRNSDELADLGLPVIDISENPHSTFGLVSTAYWQDGSRALHLSIEKADDMGKTTVAVPIDLPTFLRINPNHLNRNIAHLTKLDGRKHARPLTKLKDTFRSMAIESVSVVRNSWQQCRQVVVSQYSDPALMCQNSFNAWYRWVRPSFLGWGLVQSIVVGLMFLGAQYYTSGNFSTTPSATYIEPFAQNIVAHTLSSPASTSVSLVPSWTAPKDIATLRPAAVSSLMKTSTIPNLAKRVPEKPSRPLDPFEVHFTHSPDGRLFVNIPKKLPRKWHPRPNFVEVYEDGKRVNTSLTKLNASTYELYHHAQDSCKTHLAVVRVEGPTEQLFFQLPPRPECGFLGATKAKMDAVQVTVKHTASELGTFARHFRNQIGYTLLESSDKVQMSLKYMHEATRKFAEKTRLISSEKVAALAHSHQVMAKQSLEKMQELTTRVRDSTSTYVDSLKASSQRRRPRLSISQFASPGHNDFAAIKEQLAHGKELVVHKFHVMKSTISTWNKSFRRAVGPMEFLPTNALKTARHRATAMMQKLKEKDVVVKSTEKLSTQGGLEKKQKPKKFVPSEDIHLKERRTHGWSGFRRWV